MAIPGYQDFMLPLLRMAGDGHEHARADALAFLIKEFHITDEERKEILASGANRLANRIDWTIKYLKQAGLLRAVKKGHFQITDSGRDLLAKNPRVIDVKFLVANYPEIREFLGRNPVTDDEPPASYNEAEHAWVMRAAVEERLRGKLIRSVPDEDNRRAALELLAFVIENADEERSDGWCLRETPHGLKLMAGRLQACKVTRSKVELRVIGPVGDEIRAVLGAERDDDYEFKWIPGGVVFAFQWKGQETRYGC
jgi:Mrr restriction endonuclease-like protein